MKKAIVLTAMLLFMLSITALATQRLVLVEMMTNTS
jgi:hypothetical protein